MAKDSHRMRRRFAAVFTEAYENDAELTLGRRIERECGIDVIQYHMAQYVDWKDFFENAELRDVFDSITIASSTFQGRREDQVVAECAQILREECVGYLMGEDNIVHPKVDDAFENSRQSVINSLTEKNYPAALLNLRQAEDALMANPMDGRAAIRGIFDVVENVVKVNLKGVTNLNVGVIKEHIFPLAQKSFEDDAVQKTIAAKQVELLKAWVDACHFFRHAGKVNLTKPTDVTVIHLVSLGFSNARWLVELFDDHKL